MCYRDCKEECYDIKKAVCIRRITKEQRELINRIYKKDICHVCGSELVNARYRYSRVNIKLCTSCKNVIVRKREVS